MSITAKITGITEVEKLFNDVAKKAPAEVDATINAQSKIAKKIIQKKVPKRTGTLRKAIANKKIRKADSFTKVLQINGRRAPYGHMINNKTTVIKKGKIIGIYRDGRFMERSIPEINSSVSSAVRSIKVL